jgi:hypothetical protein
LLAVGTEGDWELIRFQLAVQGSDGIWELSSLLRAQYDTTQRSILEGERVVLMSGPGIMRIDEASNAEGVSRVLRAVTSGTSLADAEDHYITTTCLSLATASGGSGGGSTTTTDYSSVISRSLLEAPLSPSCDDTYLVGSNSPADGDAWVGHSNDLARWNCSTLSWDFVEPVIGKLILVEDESLYVYWDGTEYIEFTVEPASTNGNWVTVQTQTASASSSIDFAVDAAAYEQYMLVLQDVILSGAAELTLVAGTGVGPTWDTGNNYDFGITWEFGTAGTGTGSRAFVSATSSMRFGTVSTLSSPASNPIVGDALINGLASGENLRLLIGRTSFDGTGGLTRIASDGIHNVTTEITGLRVIPSAGTITSGKVSLLGRNF